MEVVTKNRKSSVKAKQTPSPLVKDDQDYFGDALAPKVNSKSPTPRRPSPRSKVRKRSRSTARPPQTRTAARGPAATAMLGAHPVPNPAAYSHAIPGATPAEVPGWMQMSDAGLANLVGPIHQAALGALRVAKALVDFARTAGQHLHQAQTMLDAGGFDRWVETTLAITPDEAHALMQFAQDPVVAAADVLPVKAMSLTEALGLVSRACRQ